MPSRLQDELKQTRPWESLEEEVILNIARTYAVLEHAIAQVLKPHGVTPTQYNVLRILRGAGDVGLCRNEVGERLIRPVPDVTRLLDRMEEMGLITRRRDGADRRFVTTVITAQGLALLGELDVPILEFHRARLAHLTEAQMRAAIDMLEGVRGAR
jgi:DNA-binding MarR family transcriptional regulator